MARARPRPAARMILVRRFMSEHSRVLLEQILRILLEADDDLLPDVDVEVDLDRLVRRADLHAGGRAEQERRDKKTPPHRTLRRTAPQTRQHHCGHRTGSLSL